MSIDYEYKVDKEDYANAGKISSQIKQMLKQLQMDPDLLRRIAVACYEAEINMIIHSYGGKIVVKIEDTRIQLVFDDNGPGIPNLEQALTPGWSTASAAAREFGFGAGMGLPNIKRVSDEFQIESSPKGTILILGFKV